MTLRILTIILVISALDTRAQVDCGIPDNYCMQNGTINICTGTIFDNGGGGPYTDANFTMTICPDTPGDVISLNFVAFALQTSGNPNQSDYLSIYDGNSTAAPSLGDYTGNSIQGLQVTGTVNNTSGCLTLVFTDNGAPNTTIPGFEAEAVCTTPCDPPTAVSAITNPTPDGLEQSVSVCLNAPVSFSGQGSSAAPGFNLSDYIWNFDDGTTANGQNVTHSFEEPGEYVVTLTVEDDNGCQSLNLLPLQVLVSTIPTFPGLEDQTTCFGETITLTGNAESTTWTALPPQVVAGQTYLADGAGFSYSTSLIFDFFEEGAILEDCNDLYSILVNMEHSFMGDLGLFITCPDGTTVDLVDWASNGGGGTFLGEAVDDGTNIPGVGYDYFWAPDATNGTWGQNAGGEAILPSGTYEAAGNLCDLVGCPLNGAWTFNVTDNLAVDNGYIFYWGINFNPALFPGITTFTPSIGMDADSSYWSGPHISSFDQDLDVISIFPPAPGSYDFTYTVLNSFGCQFDTTITVTFEQAMGVSAGPDQVFACGELQLEGGFQGMDAASCSEDSGVFEYCYTDNENFTWNFCPDDPGDGVTFMTFTFIQGQMEGFFDDFIVYDGPNTSSPVLANWTIGDATGQSWTATNPSGCLTIQFSSDGSVSCETGFFFQPWTYEISCSASGPQYTWEWEPAEFLNNPNIPQPTIINLSEATTFTLTGYPAGHPACASTDEVEVTIDPLGDPGISNSIQICSTDAPFDMTDELLGTPVTTGEWTDPQGTTMPGGQYDPLVNQPGVYTYTVQLPDCETFSELTVNQALPTEITIANDTSLCYLGDLNLELISLLYGQPPFDYSWTYSSADVASTEDAAYNPPASGLACLEVTDACGYVIEDCFNVLVEPLVDVEFSADTTRSCWPEAFELQILTDGSLYLNSTWEISDGTVIQNDPEYTHQFEDPGVYDVRLTLVSAIGCSYGLTVPGYLTSNAPPVAQYTLSPYPTDATDTHIFFTDASEGSVEAWEWLFNYPNTIGISNEQNPDFVFPIGSGGTYPVQFTVTDENNCTDVILSPVIINDIFQYYVPNSFTPNGDRVNDVFRFYGADIDPDRFLLQVFNRWGDMIFETDDPTQAWLGDARDGDYFCQNDVYLWRANIASLSTGERKEIEGYVTLVR